MNETEELSNPNRYKIIIHIKKNRSQKRKAKYLNNEFDFVEDINQAKIFPDMQSAESVLSSISQSLHGSFRPRIIIKYIAPDILTPQN